MRNFLIVIFITAFYSARAGKNDSVPDSSRTTRRNSVYFEALGNAGIGLYSLNWEGTRFLRKGRFSLRAGISVIDDYLFPVLVNWISGNAHKNHFEGGIGMTLPFFRKNFGLDNDLLSATVCALYRYQVPGKRFLFRAGWTPVWYFNESRDAKLFLLCVGLSVGYAL